MTKVGIIGTGRLGTLIREALEAGKAPECELIGISSRTSGITPILTLLSQVCRDLAIGV